MRIRDSSDRELQQFFRFKIEQALDFSGGQLTLGMLTSHIAKPGFTKIRDEVLAIMCKNNEIIIKEVESCGWRNCRSSILLISRIA